VRNGEFLEWARVHGCYYGTPREPVQRWLTEKRTVLFDLDVQGAQRLKTLFPEAVSVFLLPPDTRTLRQRLAERKTESDGGLKARLLTAQAEIEMAERYDYVLVNDCLDDTVASLRAIVDHP
jgi:guanylate kinase